MLSGISDGEEVIVGHNTSAVRDYDFRSPKKLTKERLKVLNNIFDNYARLLSSYYTGLLRLYCKVSLVSVEEQKYYEFNNALPDYVMMGLAELQIKDEDIDDVSAIVQLSNSITYTMIDRLLGGRGTSDEADRDFTEIEISVMKGIVTNMVNMLQEPWENYVNLTPKLTKIETNARAISNIGYDDAMAIAMMDVHINDVKAIVSVCIPALELDSVMQKYATFSAKGTRKSGLSKDDERKENIITTLSQSLLNVTAVLGETNIDMLDVMNLQTGDIIPLGKGIDTNIELSIGGKPWFDGKLGIFNNKKAIKIENVLRSEFQ